MLLDANTRFFLRYELCFRPSRNKGDALHLISDDDTLDVVSLLKDAIGDGSANLVINQIDTVELISLDDATSREAVILLFRRRNPAASVPVLENVKTKRLRRISKSVDEAPAVSAHLFIRKSRSSGAWPTYSAILEEVPGLGRSYMQALIGRILRSAPYECLDKEKEAFQTHSVVDLHGIQGANLEKTLKESVISGVQLVRPPSTQGLDTAGVIKPRYEILQLSVSPEATDSVRIVRTIRKWADRSGWSDVKVLFKMPDDRSRVVTVGREEDAKDVLFVRAEEVRTKASMDLCTDKVNEELLAYAVRLWRNARN